MRAVELGVGVDHLGLEPQPELHAQRADALGERRQALGPHVVVDPPVAEARGVVAAAVEPTVVQHEPLDTDPCGPVGDLVQARQVVVEEDGFPHVQHDRLVSGVRRKGPLVGVEGLREAVQALVGRPEDHPGRGVHVALHEHDLTRLEQLAAAEGGAELGGALDSQTAVAAPGDMGSHDCAAAGAEAGSPENGDGCAAEPGPALTALAHPQAVGDGVSLRGALTLVPPGEVEHLDQVVGGREHDVQGNQVVGAGTRAVQGVATPQQPTWQGLELGGQHEAGRRVSGADRQALVGFGHLVDHEAGRPGRVGSRRARAVPHEVGTGEELVGVLAEERHPRPAEQRGVATRRGRRGGRDARPQDPREEVAAATGVELEGELGRAVEAAGREEHGSLSGSLRDRTSPGGRRRATYGGGSALHCSSGEAADEEPLQRQEHDDRHDHREHARCGDELLVLALLAEQL